MTQEEEETDSAWRAKMLRRVEGGDLTLSLDALLALTLNDPDGPWLERFLLDCLDRELDPQLKELAVTCIGHVARIHGRLSDKTVVPRLRELAERSDDLAGQAQDALEDIEIFASGYADN